MIQTAKHRAEELSAIKAKKSKFKEQILIPVRINAKTFIFIKQGKDPQTERQRFLEKLQKSEDDLKVRADRSI